MQVNQCIDSLATTKYWIFEMILILSGYENSYHIMHSHQYIGSKGPSLLKGALLTSSGVHTPYLELV